MPIRKSNPEDINVLAELDRGAYGKYGADKKYFKRFFSSSKAQILVVEEEHKMTGFTVLEFLDANEMPNNFSDLNLQEPLSGRWMNIVAFTTKTNFFDKESDNQLVLEAEHVGKKWGCVSSCVPLTKNHPFAKNGVYHFWESNGYKSVGTIDWVADDGKKFGCIFYKKDLV